MDEETLIKNLERLGTETLIQRLNRLKAINDANGFKFQWIKEDVPLPEVIDPENTYEPIYRKPTPPKHIPRKYFPPKPKKKPSTLKQIGKVATKKILKWKSKKASPNWWVEEHIKQTNYSGAIRIKFDYKYRHYFHYKLPEFIEETGENSFLFKAEYEERS